MNEELLSIFGRDLSILNVKVICQNKEIQEIISEIIAWSTHKKLVILIKPRQLYTVMQIIHLTIKLKELFWGRTVYIWWLERDALPRLALNHADVERLLWQCYKNGGVTERRNTQTCQNLSQQISTWNES